MLRPGEPINVRCAMKQPIEPNTLWLVVLRNAHGAHDTEIWRSPAGRDGLRRIFRLRDPGMTVVGATSMDILSQVKLPGRLGTFSRMTRGGHQAVLVNAGGDVPSMITVQAHTPKAAMQVAQEAGFAGLAAVDMERVRTALVRMRGITQEAVGHPDRDLIAHPPSHTGVEPGPSAEELAALALRDEKDVWNLVSNRTGAR